MRIVQFLCNDIRNRRQVFWGRATVLFFCLGLVSSLFADDGLLQGLSAQPRQGALIIGKAVPGAEVLLEGEPLAVTAAGDFVFGVGRDDVEDRHLTVRLGQRTETHRLPITSRQWSIQNIEGVPPRTVNPPQDALDRIRSEAAQVTDARSHQSEQPWFLRGFIWPLEGTITGVFGSQRVFNGHPRRPHFGTDIAAPEGTAIRAPAAGRVALAHADMFFSGGTIIIDHGFGVSTSYLHLSEISVTVDDEIEQGDMIGKVGATGRATGPHLCWRLNWFQTRLDPELVVQ